MASKKAFDIEVGDKVRVKGPWGVWSSVKVAEVELLLYSKTDPYKAKTPPPTKLTRDLARGDGGSAYSRMLKSDYPYVEADRRYRRLRGAVIDVMNKQDEE